MLTYPHIFAVWIEQIVNDFLINLHQWIKAALTAYLNKSYQSQWRLYLEIGDCNKIFLVRRCRFNVIEESLVHLQHDTNTPLNSIPVAVKYNKLTKGMIPGSLSEPVIQ